MELMTVQKPGIHRHQTPSRYRNAAIATHRRFTAHYGPTWRHPRHRKYITHRNAARGGPRHGHRESAQQISWDRSSGYRDMLADRHTQTNWSQYSSLLPGQPQSNHRLFTFSYAMTMNIVYILSIYNNGCG